MSEVEEPTAILPEALSAFFHYLHHIPTPHGKSVGAPLLIVHHHCVFTRNLRVARDRAELSSCWHSLPPSASSPYNTPNLYLCVAPAHIYSSSAYIRTSKGKTSAVLGFCHLWRFW